MISSKNGGATGIASQNSFMPLLKCGMHIRIHVHIKHIMLIVHHTQIDRFPTIHGAFITVTYQRRQENTRQRGGLVAHSMPSYPGTLHFFSLFRASLFCCLLTYSKQWNILRNSFLPIWQQATGDYSQRSWNFTIPSRRRSIHLNYETPLSTVW